MRLTMPIERPARRLRPAWLCSLYVDGVARP